MSHLAMVCAEDKIFRPRKALHNFSPRTRSDSLALALTLALGSYKAPYNNCHKNREPCQSYPRSKPSHCGFCTSLDLLRTALALMALTLSCMHPYRSCHKNQEPCHRERSKASNCISCTSSLDLIRASQTLVPLAPALVPLALAQDSTFHPPPVVA